MSVKAVKKKGPRESQSNRKLRLVEIIALLQRYYPEAHCALNFSNPHELLVATILSAQCTDERVNQVTPTLFQRFPGVRALAEAPLEELEEIVRPTGFFRNKAKNIKACAMALVESHGSEVPPILEDLVGLAGVGRKTAHVVLGNAFGIASGVVVDTHVTRLANRLGLVRGDNAVQIERELNQLVDPEHWVMFSHWLIEHGRKVCKARSPQCHQCFLEGLCPKKGVGKKSC